MNTIFYCTEKNLHDGIFSSLIKCYSSKDNFEIYTNIEMLSSRFQHPHECRTVTVVYAETIDDLIDVYLIKHLLYKTALILMLPDDEKETIAMSFLLRPVLTFGTNSNSSEMLAALKMIITYYNDGDDKDCHTLHHENQAKMPAKSFRRAA